MTTLLPSLHRTAQAEVARAAASDRDAGRVAALEAELAAARHWAEAASADAAGLSQRLSGAEVSLQDHRAAAGAAAARVSELSRDLDSARAEATRLQAALAVQQRSASDVGAALSQAQRLDGELAAARLQAAALERQAADAQVRTAGERGSRARCLQRTPVCRRSGGRRRLRPQPCAGPRRRRRLLWPSCAPAAAPWAPATPRWSARPQTRALRLRGWLSRWGGRAPSRRPPAAR